MSSCCTCPTDAGQASQNKTQLPLICLVPRDTARSADTGGVSAPRQATSAPAMGEMQFEPLDDEYIRKHFKLPQRALYLDPFRRPLITFPMTQEHFTSNFNIARKSKINQQILDGFLDPSEAITAPSVFPYAKPKLDLKKAGESEEEIIYVLQLPDYEYRCPVHNQIIRTPRYIWHSCKKAEKEKSGELKKGKGPLHKPKPWLLSRHTDFDLMSQW